MPSCCRYSVLCSFIHFLTPSHSGSSVLVCCSFFHPSPPLPLFYLPLSHHCFPFHPPPPPASLQQLLSPLSFFHFAGKIKMISEHKTYTSCTTAWGNPPAVALHFSARPLVVGLPSRGDDNDFFYHACPCSRLFACDKDDVWYVCDESCFSSSPSLTCPQRLLC